MKNICHKYKYIGFFMILTIIFVLCFGILLVFAEPETDAPGESASVSTESSEVDPGETEAISTEVVQEPSSTPEDSENISETPVLDTPEQTTEVAPETETPSVTTNQPENTTPLKTTESQTTTEPQTTTAAQATTTPPSTTANTPTKAPSTPTPTQNQVTTEPSLVTMDTLAPGEALPTYNPQITSESQVYNNNIEQDLHGYVIRIAAKWDETTDPNLDTQAIEEFKKKYNCDVVFLDLTDEVIYNRLLMSCATGITYFDAVLTEAGNILVNFEPMGLLEEFSKYLTDEEIAAISKSYQKVLSADGKLYAIPAHAPDFSGIWVNNTVLKNYKISSPVTNNYNKGTWSWNNFMQTLYNATGDKNGDGYFDIYGLAAMSDIHVQALESVGGSVFRWTGSKFISGITNNATVSGLSVVRNLFNNYYIANDYEKFFYLQKAGFLAGEASMYPDLEKYLPKADISFLPYPSAANGEEAVSVASSAQCAAIVKTSRYPAHTAELLKILYGVDNFNKRVENYCTENGFSDQVKKSYMKMLENFTVDYAEFFDNEDRELRNTLVSELKNGTFSQERAEMVIQPIIDKLIKEKEQYVDLKKIPVEITW